MKFLFHTAFLTTLLLSPLMADTIYLKDGTKLQGDLKHTENGWTISQNGQTTDISADQVQSIELIPPKDATPKAAAERLESLRRSVENVDDLSEIILRYHRFIDQINDPAAIAAAKSDLETWQDRSNQKMVKVGKKWILPADRDKLIQEAIGLAEQGRQLMKQGRTREAEPILSASLDDDPQNVSALYLLGLLRYQQEQFLPARKALDAVAYLVPNHAPTLNNLAVVQWRQRQYIPALISYDSAMLARPGNKTILDNVAVALELLPLEYHNSPVTRRVTRRFNEQDKLLAEQMAASGLHRHGADWISDADFQKLQDQDRARQAALDALAVEFDKANDRLAQLDQDIQDTESQMHRIEASSYLRDPTTGILVRLPFPSVYYDLEKDDKREHTERDDQVKKMDVLQQKAKALQQPAAGEKPTDTQQMIGPEGTPLASAAAPATQPSTQPDPHP
jgi:Flp pilus assembly protein TadD